MIVRCSRDRQNVTSFKRRDRIKEHSVIVSRCSSCSLMNEIHFLGQFLTLVKLAILIRQSLTALSLSYLHIKSRGHRQTYNSTLAARTTSSNGNGVYRILSQWYMESTSTAHEQLINEYHRIGDYAFLPLVPHNNRRFGLTSLTEKKATNAVYHVLPRPHHTASRCSSFRSGVHLLRSRHTEGMSDSSATISTTLYMSTARPASYAT